MTTKGKASQRLTMKGQIHKAYKVLLKVINPRYMKSDQNIPLSVIKDAKGIAFITVIKAGFVFSGTAGCGIVIAKKEDGTWSGPSSLGCGGMGWGLQIGASSTDSIIILRTSAAVKAFSGKGQVKLGTSISIAAGPVGREAEAAVSAGSGFAPIYAYSHTRGAFAGLSLQGAVLFARDSDNKKFYGEKVDPIAILAGAVEPPPNEDLELLYKTLRVITNSETNDFEYRDTETGSLRLNKYDSSSMYDNSSSNMESINQSYDSMSLGPSLDSSTASSSNLSSSAAIPINGNGLNNKPTSNLPTGWKELQTEDGQTYYWNEAENKTQWERPIAPAIPLAIPSSQQQPSPVFAKTEPVVLNNSSNNSHQTALNAAISNRNSPSWGNNNQPTDSSATKNWQQEAEKTVVNNVAASYGVPKSVTSQIPPGAVSQGAQYAIKHTTADQQAAIGRQAANSMGVPKSVTSHVPSAAITTGAAAYVKHSANTNSYNSNPSAYNSNQNPPQPVSYSSPPQPVSYNPPPPQQQQVSYNSTSPSPPSVNMATRPSSFRAPAPLPTKPSTTAQNFSPYPQVPAPSISVESTISPNYTYEQVIARTIPGIQPTKLEEYLTNDEFQKVFSMPRTQFSQLPKWKREKMKKDKNLF